MIEESHFFAWLFWMEARLIADNGCLAITYPADMGYRQKCYISAYIMRIYFSAACEMRSQRYPTSTCDETRYQTVPSGATEKWCMNLVRNVASKRRRGQGEGCGASFFFDI